MLSRLPRYLTGMDLQRGEVLLQLVLVVVVLVVVLLGVRAAALDRYPLPAGLRESCSAPRKRDGLCQCDKALLYYRSLWY